MNILFHGWEYPPNGGGVGVYMRNMAEALVRIGHGAMVLTGHVEGYPEETKENGVLVLRKYNRNEIGSSRVRDLALSLAREHSCDVIEGADCLGDCASILRAPHSIPVLIKVHTCQVIKVLQDAHVYYPWQRFTMAVARLRAYRQMKDEKDSIERADFLTVPSRRLMDELLKQGMKLPAKRAVLPNPIQALSPGDGKDTSYPSILFVGRIEFLKGIQFLPSMISCVRNKIPEAKLEIAGADSYARWVGSLKSWLEKRLGDQLEHVSFLGRLDRAQLDEAFRRTWVVVVPSLWDNFPTVVLEAMVHGKPVVTTSYGGMPEMLKGTGCPIVDPESIEFPEAVISLLQDKSLREDISSRVLAKVAKDYSPEAIVPRYVETIQSWL